MTIFVDSNPHICHFSVTNNHVFDTYHKYNILFPNRLKKSKYLKDNFKTGPYLSEKLTWLMTSSRQERRLLFLIQLLKSKKVSVLCFC